MVWGSRISAKVLAGKIKAEVRIILMDMEAWRTTFYWLGGFYLVIQPFIYRMLGCSQKLASKLVGNGMDLRVSQLAPRTGSHPHTK